MSLYANPALYRAFFEPSVEMRASIDALVRRHHAALHAKRRPVRAGARSAAVRRVIDPACGPATWIGHFADRGAEVVGVDVEPKAVRAARGALAHHDATVLVGDMRDLPSSVKGPFDLAINPDNSIGHLGGLADVASHLRSMHALLCDRGSPRGHYVVGLAVREPDDVVAEESVFERGPVPVDGGGFAAIRTETLGLVDVGHPDGLRCERIRHTILAQGVEGVGPIVIEQYDLLTFPFGTLRSLIADAGPWDVVDCRDATDESLPRRQLARGCGDVLLVLRPAAPARWSRRPLRRGLVVRRR